MEIRVGEDPTSLIKELEVPINYAQERIFRGDQEPP
jgi:hypothetical protein